MNESLFNREQLLAGAVLGEPFSSIVYRSNATPPRRLRILQNCLHRHSPSPGVCIGDPKFFRSAPNFPEQPVKWVSAYNLHNKKYRIICC